MVGVQWGKRLLPDAQSRSQSPASSEGMGDQEREEGREEKCEEMSRWLIDCLLPAEGFSECFCGL